MPGRIIGCFCCLLCALPFFYLAWEGKQKNAAPLAFWSGDNSLKDKLKDIPAYNTEMSRLYKRHGRSFILYGILFLLSSPIGVVAICLECTAGLYILWKSYQRILDKYARKGASHDSA